MSSRARNYPAEESMSLPFVCIHLMLPEDDGNSTGSKKRFTVSALDTTATTTDYGSNTADSVIYLWWMLNTSQEKDLTKPTSRFEPSVIPGDFVLGVPTPGKAVHIQ